MSGVRVLHIPALVVWIIGLAGLLNQLYGFVNFLSVWANAIVSPSESSVLAFLVHGIMFVGGLAAHLGIEKMT
jgi:hypothetical protein